MTCSATCEADGLSKVRLQQVVEWDQKASFGSRLSWILVGAQRKGDWMALGE